MKTNPEDLIKGRGAQKAVHNRFEALAYTPEESYLEFLHRSGEADTDRTSQIHHKQGSQS